MDDGLGERLEHLKTALDALAKKAFVPEGAAASDRAPFQEAVANFLAAGPELLESATAHVYAYYQSVAREFDEAQRVDYGIPQIASAAHVWDHVVFALPPNLELGTGPLEPAPCYLSYEGEAAWEPEHGIQLVFDDQGRLCKVSPFDGHSTNASAYGDASLLGEVFIDRA